ncbi:unnamed protein product [Spodoptera littoralis]|uniref:Uncharacterized protein n=1 Tax=Spodoptera littoralis TaxID=7109 RepID=A0A9P0IID9_SPOLI|nr:unnamed protein product [Spodoptera littoralis]CAH1647553.1 unnamed protein product [Spodoptera littoralis]
MVESVLNKYCLVSKVCCFCVSLRNGCILIALAGFIPCLYLFMVYASGDSTLLNNGVNEVVTEIILHIYAILGLVLCGVNIILFVGAITFNEKLILNYLRFACVYFVVDFASVLVICISAALSGYLPFAGIFFLVDVCYWALIYFYILPIVNGFRKKIHTIVIYVN